MSVSVDGILKTQTACHVRIQEPVEHRRVQGPCPRARRTPPICACSASRPRPWTPHRRIAAPACRRPRERRRPEPSSRKSDPPAAAAAVLPLPEARARRSARSSPRVVGTPHAAAAAARTVARASGLNTNALPTSKDRRDRTNIFWPVGQVPSSRCEPKKTSRARAQSFRFGASIPSLSPSPSQRTSSRVAKALI